MLELVAIRTLLSLHVLKKIPLDGSISLQELSQATGAQDSLLGTFSLNIASVSYVSPDSSQSDCCA